VISELIEKLANTPYVREGIVACIMIIFAIVLAKALTDTSDKVPEVGGCGFRWNCKNAGKDVCKGKEPCGHYERR